MLESISSWIEDPQSPPLYWLNGLAGTGKSTIARTVAQTFYDKHERRNLGSFFFSRGSVEVDNAKSFFTTIAVQLAVRDSDLGRSIREAARSNSTIGDKSLKDQWQELILNPLSSSGSEHVGSTVLIVIDALDECGDEENVKALLRLFTDIPCALSGCLRIFLTSRPNLPIRHHLSQVTADGHRTLVLHSVASESVNADIRRYLSGELGSIRKERGYSSDWADATVVDQLTKHAAGLFIYAATTCRFVQQGKKFADRRLVTILDQSRTAASEPERQLDEIYELVLSNAVSPDYAADEEDDAFAQLRLVLGSLVTLWSSPTIEDLSAFTQISAKDIAETLENLHAVLDLTEGVDSRVYLHHPSFRDFLTDPMRCKNSRLRIDRAESNRTLAHACLHIMTRSLKRYIGDSNLPAKPGPPPGMCGEDRLDLSRQGLTKHAYSCRFWQTHLNMMRDKPHTVAEFEGILWSFLSMHFLHWLEIWSWRHHRQEPWIPISKLIRDVGVSVVTSVSRMI